MMSKLFLHMNRNDFAVTTTSEKVLIEFKDIEGARLSVAKKELKGTDELVKLEDNYEKLLRNVERRWELEEAKKYLVDQERMDWEGAKYQKEIINSLGDLNDPKLVETKIGVIDKELASINELLVDYDKKVDIWNLERDLWDARNAAGIWRRHYGDLQVDFEKAILGGDFKKVPSDDDKVSKLNHILYRKEEELAKTSKILANPIVTAMNVFGGNIGMMLNIINKDAYYSVVNEGVKRKHLKEDIKNLKREIKELGGDIINPEKERLEAVSRLEKEMGEKLKLIDADEEWRISKEYHTVELDNIKNERMDWMFDNTKISDWGVKENEIMDALFSLVKDKEEDISLKIIDENKGDVKFKEILEEAKTVFDNKEIELNDLKTELSELRSGLKKLEVRVNEIKPKEPEIDKEKLDNMGYWLYGDYNR